MPDHLSIESSTNSCVKVEISPTTTVLVVINLRKQVRRRKLPTQAHRTRCPLNGQRRTKHQRFPIFPLHCQDCMVGRQARRFGSVVEGMNVVKDIEKVGSQSGKTSRPVKIEAC